MKPPKRRSPIPTIGAGLLVLFGCRGDRTTAGLDRDPSDPQALELSPIGGVVTGGDTIRFAAQVVRRDGSRAPAVRPGFEATGGQIDSSGLYRATAATGVFQVRARVRAGVGELSAEANVQVVAPVAVVLGLEVVPDSVAMAVGAEQVFEARARLSDGSFQAASVTWLAAGGSIDAAGRFVAASVPGTALVVATNTLAGRFFADTATVIVTAAPGPPPPPPPPLVAVGVELSPDQAVVLAGAARQFSVVARMSDGSAGSASGTFRATGGQIAGTGLFTAGPTPGTFLVWFEHPAGLSDTSLIEIKVPAPTLIRVELSPDQVTVPAGGLSQFSVVGRMSDSSTAPVPGTYRATGGQVTAAGLFTAGQSPGAFRVWFEHPTGKADTSAVLVQAPVPPPPPPPPGGPLGVNADLTARRLFPADNPWNQPVDTAAVDPLSDQIVANIGPAKSFHPDFGADWNGGPFGIPYVVVAGTQARAPVTFAYWDESDPGPYPLPPNAPIEGGASSGGDRHVLVVDRDNWLLYELFAAYPQPDGSWQAGSGAIFDLNSNALRPAGWTSADAAGLPILPGLVRFDEVAAGTIAHALRFTVSRTQKAYLPPARHWASSDLSSLRPPMGMRVRLKASYDISAFPPSAQVILRALKRYGMIVADNGSDWYLSGVADSRWNDAEINTLKRLRGSDFEVVRMTGLVTP